MDDREIPERQAGHARWLARREPARESMLAHYLLSPATVERETITTLELAEERELRIAIGRQLGDQAAELAALREQVETLRRQLLPEARGHATRTRRLVELTHECAAPEPGYWLRRCEGFQVEVDASLLGRVEGVRFGRRHDRPDALIVAAGRWRRRPLLVPVDAVAEISPERERITLSADAGIKPPRTRRQGEHQPLLRTLARRLHRLHPGTA